MNFFEQQVRTKKSTVVLVTLFILCALSFSFAISYLVTLFFLSGQERIVSFSPAYVFTHIPLPYLLIYSLAPLYFMLYKSIKKYRELSKGGSTYIIKSLCGRLASKRGSAKENVLINVVEEIAVASDIPPPPVYILDADDTINAFAAGYNYDDAVIGVTAGAVKYLTREELQGVIAHEFSHIFNGDMRLNTITIGILNGISAIGLAGESFIKEASKLKRLTVYVTTDDNNNDNSLLVGVFLYVIGLPGLLLGNLIKAALNREREYLADATAAQFTRYPKGLANALKKIGGMGSFISSNRTGEFSHLYFANGNSFRLFNFHPSIDKRIYALDPNWDGIYILTEPAEAIIKAQTEKPKSLIKAETSAKEQYARMVQNKKREKQAREKAVKILTVSSILVEHAKTQRRVDNAAEILKNIPQLLHDSAGNLPDAQFIIFAVLMESDEEIRKIQREIIAQVYLGICVAEQQPEYSPPPEGWQSEGLTGWSRKDFNKETAEKFENIESEVLKYPRDLHLNIINISIPTLKSLPKEEYLKFKETVIKLIEADNKVTWREINLKYLILYPLDIIFGIRKPAHETYIYIGAIKSDAATLLSKLTYHQFNDDERARQAFTKTVRDFGVVALEYVPSQNITTADIERACDTIQKAKIPLRKKILEISIACLKTDGELSTQDLETLHALSALLHLPLPSPPP